MQAGSDYVWNSSDHLAARVSPTNDQDLAAIARGLSRRSNGYVSSGKNEASLPWRSRVERDLMRVFELDHGIVSYVSMPEKVELVLGGKHHRVVPALGAMTVRGPMVFDVFRSDGPQSPARLAIAQERAESLPQAALAIDSFAALVEELGARLEPNADALRQVLAQLRLAFVEVSGMGEVSGSDEVSDTPPDP